MKRIRIEENQKDVKIYIKEKITAGRVGRLIIGILFLAPILILIPTFKRSGLFDLSSEAGGKIFVLIMLGILVLVCAICFYFLMLLFFGNTRYKINSSKLTYTYCFWILPIISLTYRRDRIKKPELIAGNIEMEHLKCANDIREGINRIRYDRNYLPVDTTMACGGINFEYYNKKIELLIEGEKSEIQDFLDILARHLIIN